MNFIMKPTSFHCNLACQYCFYLEKADFMTQPTVPAIHCMTIELVENLMEQAVKSAIKVDISFTWQGGEPLLAGLDFYKQVVIITKHLAKKYGKRIHHAIQTNGTMIDDAWAKFFNQARFLVGVSIDGDQELHDIYRQTSDGKGTLAKVVRGIEFLKTAQVEFNTLTVVNSHNVHEPLRVYKFLKSLGVKFMQFIPVVETIGLDAEHKPSWFDQPALVPQTTSFSVAPEDYGEFMVKIFHEWVKNDVTKVSIRLFDSLLAQFSQQAATLCIFKESCGSDNIAVEVNGEMYQCDHFVYPVKQFQLGNLQNYSVADVRDKIATWSRFKRDLSLECTKCQWLTLCHGGCPKHRFAVAEGMERKSYFCAGYKYIFTELTPGLNLIMEFLEKKLPWEYLPAAMERVYQK